MIGQTVILALTIAMVSGLINDHPCCFGDNIYKNRTCQEGEAPDFNCPNGRYMLDPLTSELDSFTITKDGMLKSADSPDVSS